MFSLALPHAIILLRAAPRRLLPLVMQALLMLLLLITLRISLLQLVLVILLLPEFDEPSVVKRKEQHFSSGQASLTSLCPIAYELISLIYDQ